MVSRNHIPCIWFQWYDFIYHEIMTWFHIWTMVSLWIWYHNFIMAYHMISYVIYACIMIGLTMMSWVWFYTRNYDIIGNVMVSWNHIPCIWFQWYDVIYQYIMMWYHVWKLDMISWFYFVWFHVLYACMYDIIETKKIAAL